MPSPVITLFIAESQPEFKNCDTIIKRLKRSLYKPPFPWKDEYDNFNGQDTIYLHDFNGNKDQYPMEALCELLAEGYIQNVHGLQPIKEVIILSKLHPSKWCKNLRYQDTCLTDEVTRVTQILDEKTVFILGKTNKQYAVKKRLREPEQVDMTETRKFKFTKEQLMRMTPEHRKLWESSMEVDWFGNVIGTNQNTLANSMKEKDE